MKVYVVFHCDIEDDKSVRGVFLSRESAEALTHERLDFTTYGPDTPKRHFEATDDRESLCCSVQEWEAIP